MIKAHKIRLHPTPEQANYFARAAGTARFTCHWAVAEWQREYQAGGKPSALALRTKFNALKKEQFPWVYEVTKCVVEGAFMDVAVAFKNFFEGRKAGIRNSKARNALARLSIWLMINSASVTIGSTCPSWDA